MDEQGNQTEGSPGKAAGERFNPATAEAIVLATFGHLQDSLLANEEMGERRFQMYLTVLGAAGVGLGLVADNSEGDGRGLLMASGVVCIAVWILGVATLMRIAKRDVDTTDAIRHLALGRQVAYCQLGLTRILPWGDPEAVEERRWRWTGLVGQLTIINSFVFALGAGCLMQADGHTGWWKVIVGGVAFGGSCLGLWAIVAWVYRRETIRLRVASGA